MPKVDKNSLASGLLLIGIGAFAGFASRNLETMLAGNMGPGYFPRVLSGLLIVLGLALVAGGLSGRGTTLVQEGQGPIPWRAVVLLTAALLWFALTVRPLGLGPALAVAILLSCFGTRRSRLWPSLLLSFLMVFFAWAVFIRGLRMPVPLFGPWFH